MLLLLADGLCRVTSELMFPYKEDLMRFDFEVEPEDEYMCDFFAKGAMRTGIETPEEPAKS